MTYRIIFSHRCNNCYAKLAEFDINNLTRYENSGFILNENEVENINVINNIVQCRACGTNLGIMLSDNNIILFRQYLQAEAYIQTRFWIINDFFLLVLLWVFTSIPFIIICKFERFFGSLYTLSTIYWFYTAKLIRIIFTNYVGYDYVQRISRRIL